MITKDECRAYIRSLKKRMPPARAVAESRRIMERLERMPEFLSARCITLYWSLPDEVETHDFIRKWWEKKRILLPVVCGDSALNLVPCGPRTVMESSAFRIREPQGPPVAVSQADQIVVPGMAFDGSGHRLGRGKGYYDRLLSGTQALKVGVCFGFQFLERVPTDPHDVAVDRVIHG